MNAVAFARVCGDGPRRTACSSLAASLVSSLVAALVVAGAATSQGCLARSYEIHKPELARLAAVPPVLRGMRVEVEQELSTSAVEPAAPVNERTVIVTGGVGMDLGGPSYARPRPAGGGGGFSSSRGGAGRKGGAASDARATAISILVLATFGVIIAGVVEGERFEGTVQVYPMHPVHLFGHDGGYRVMPLAAIDPETVQWTERAVIRAAEGPMRTVARAPLRRHGLSYGLHFGVTQLPSGDGTHTSGPAGIVHFGYFPAQTVGLLATGSFGWRENLVGYTVYEQRYGAELQLMPLSTDIFHAGAYVGAGVAWRLEDGFSRGNDRSPTVAGGLQLQLDVDTHIALSLRFGLHTGHESGYDDPLRETSFGIAIY
jgi:hypothetical protein